MAGAGVRRDRGRRVIYTNAGFWTSSMARPTGSRATVIQCSGSPTGRARRSRTSRRAIRAATARVSRSTRAPDRCPDHGERSTSIASTAARPGVGPGLLNSGGEPEVAPTGEEFDDERSLRGVDREAEAAGARNVVRRPGRSSIVRSGAHPRDVSIADDTARSSTRWNEDRTVIRQVVGQQEGRPVGCDAEHRNACAAVVDREASSAPSTSTNQRASTATSELGAYT